MIDLTLLKKVLQIAPTATDDDINGTMEALSVALGKRELDGEPELEQERQTADDADLEKNNLVKMRDQSGAINTVHKDSPDAKKLFALSAELLPKIRALAATGSRISPLEREIMQKLGLSEAQWVRHGGRP
jgi:hypothetical protein